MTTTPQLEKPIVWIDIETGGLDIETQPILEIAVIVTDADLNEIGAFSRVIHHEESVLNAMEKWPKEQHQKSGLTEEVRQSANTPKQVEESVVEFLSKFVKREEAPLAGNSVHFDRKFMDKHMPKITNYLHYRNIDVSTLFELAMRWAPMIIPRSGTTPHRALEDIQKSIGFLKTYKKKLFDAKHENHVHFHFDPLSEKTSRKRKKPESSEEGEEYDPRAKVLKEIQDAVMSAFL